MAAVTAVTAVALPDQMLEAGEAVLAVILVMVVLVVAVQLVVTVREEAQVAAARSTRVTPKAAVEPVLVFWVRGLVELAVLMPIMTLQTQLRVLEERQVYVRLQLTDRLLQVFMVVVQQHKAVAAMPTTVQSAQSV
tara:strand:- start:197 stop:604 length:408 start_codon:yes stop_codon:yes gene_type:complete